MVAFAYGSAATLILLLAGLFTLHRFSDFDVFWQVKTGEWILQNGRVPHSDPFGVKTAGLPWLDVAWGSQIIGALVVQWVGLVGLQLLIAAGVVATMAVFFKRSVLNPTVLACALAFVLTAGQRFLVRPDILSLGLTMAALALIDRLAGDPRRGAVQLAVFTAAWVNLHGSFILVLLLLGAAAVGSLFSSDRMQLLKVHAGAIFLAGAAALVNPYTFRIYGVFVPYIRSMLATVGLLSSTEYLGVSEWTPTWRILITDPVFPRFPFVALLVLMALSFQRLGRSASPARIACALAISILGLAAIRNVLPFCAAGLWIVARNERDRMSRRLEGDSEPGDSSGARRWARMAAAAVVALLAGVYCLNVLSDSYYVDRDLPLVTGVGPNPDLVPEGAVQWLAEHEPPGRMFNNYNSGAYLLYRLFPHVRPYIDSRFDVTPAYREIQQALADPAAFDSLVERDGIGTIVLLHPAPESISLLPIMARDTRWTLAFQDANSTIHVRSGPSAPRLRPVALALAPAIEPAAERINTWLAGFKRASLPAAELTDALVSGILGDRARQREAYRRALIRAPGNPQALRYFEAYP